MSRKNDSGYESACYSAIQHGKGCAPCAKNSPDSPKEFRILASQAVVDLFLEEESDHLAILGDFIGKPISLQVESLYSQEQYDIVLI